MNQINSYIKQIFDEGKVRNLAEIFEIKHYPKNFTFGPHRHVNIEINYVRSGKCYLKIDEKRYYLYIDIIL